MISLNAPTDVTACCVRSLYIYGVGIIVGGFCGHLFAGWPWPSCWRMVFAHLWI